MPDDRSDPLADLFTMFAMPVSGTLRSVEQFRKGVDEFLVGVENFNRTMANLNETTERINSLLADVEDPIRAAVPQVTRTVKAADEMMQVVSGPAMAVAPGLAKLAETLNTPAFAQLPAQIGQFSELLGEVSRRLAPLAQVAESAGGLFGGLRVPGMRAPQRPEASTAATSTSPTVKATRIVQTTPAEQEIDVDEEAPEEPEPDTKKAPAPKKASSAKKKAPAKKKSPAKKTASAKKRAPAKKAPAKKTSSAKATSPAKKAAAPSASSASSATGSDE